MTNSKACLWLALLSKADNIHWKLVWGSGKSGGNLASQKREGQGEGSMIHWPNGNIYHQTVAIHLKSGLWATAGDSDKNNYAKTWEDTNFYFNRKKIMVYWFYTLCFEQMLLWLHMKKKKHAGKGHQHCKAKLSECDTINIFHAVLIWPTCEYAF